MDLVCLCFFFFFLHLEWQFFCGVSTPLDGTGKGKRKKNPHVKFRVLLFSFAYTIPHRWCGWLIFNCVCVNEANWSVAWVIMRSDASWSKAPKATANLIKEKKNKSPHNSQTKTCQFGLCINVACLEVQWWYREVSRWIVLLTI